MFEKNAKLGEKVAITGGGRCNITTALRHHKEILSQYVRGGEFLSFALRKRSPKAMFQRCEAHDVPLKIEADNKVFPVSDTSADIISLFTKIISGAQNCTIYTNTSVQNISHEKNIFHITTNNGSFDAEKVVITTGGNAYQHTGSTGDAYARAKHFGHRITALAPSLTSFLTQEERVHACS